MSSDKNIERQAKLNLFWKKNATYRNIFLALFILICLIFGKYGPGLLTTNPSLGRPLLYALLPICLIAYFYINRLYKTTVAELTPSEIEAEKIQLVASGATKTERRLFIFFSIILGIIVVGIILFVLMISLKWFPL